MACCVGMNELKGDDDMKRMIMSLVVLLFAMGTGSVATAGDQAAPSADDQVKGLEQMCEENASARAERHAETTLYERLGKERAINALTQGDLQDPSGQRCDLPHLRRHQRRRGRKASGRLHDFGAWAVRRSMRIGRRFPTRIVT